MATRSVFLQEWSDENADTLLNKCSHQFVATLQRLPATCCVHSMDMCCRISPTSLETLCCVGNANENTRIRPCCGVSNVMQPRTQVLPNQAWVAILKMCETPESLFTDKNNIVSIGLHHDVLPYSNGHIIWQCWKPCKASNTSALFE